MLVTMTTSARQLQEGAVALVGLDHHPVAGAQPRVGAVGVDDAAIDHGRIEAAGVEQGRDHRRRRGLAVGAGNRDAALQPHQFGEHLGAAHHGNALRARRHQFRIVALDRGRHHDHVGAVDILGLVADRDRRCPSRAAARHWRRRPRPSPARSNRDCSSTSAMPLMPMPPIPTKWMGPISRGSLMRCSLYLATPVN